MAAATVYDVIVVWAGNAAICRRLREVLALEQSQMNAEERG